MNDTVFKMNLPPENIKYFVYKEKKYPFDYDLLKRSSLYISKNDQNFRTQTNINLIDNQKFELSPDSITNFIQCCENQNFHVNESNDIISANFLSYINTKDLTLLPIQVLYRLIDRYASHLNQIDENLVNFLFKCLDKYGREASILFSLIHVEQQQNDVIQRLLSEPYYDIFDFTFINSTLLETTRNLSSKLNRLEIKCSQELSAMKQLLSEFEEMKESFETKFIPLTTSISFTPQLISIKVDEEVTLTAVIEPEKAIKIIKWSVSDDRIQIKNEKGTAVEEYSGSQIVLRGIHTGESTVTAMTVDGSNIQATVTVAVFQPVRSITIEPKVINIKLNEEMKITANVEPKDASNKNVIWRISGSEIQMKDSSGNAENEITGSEIILRGINEGVSTLTLTAEDGSNIQCQTLVTVSYGNKLNYAYGARVTYISATPYNVNSNFYASTHGGYTGKNTPVNSSLVHSQDNFWGALNSYNTQGALENDDNKNNINMLHSGEQKNPYSSTTVSVSRESTTVTIIINPRAYYGDISNYTFLMSECYLASSNSDGNVGKYKIYVSTSNDESVATNPNDSSWTDVTEGSLKTDVTLTKVYSGGVNFKYIILDLNSRGKSYIELSAIKVF